MGIALATEEELPLAFRTPNSKGGTSCTILGSGIKIFPPYSTAFGTGKPGSLSDGRLRNESAQIVC
jgi:hypothetical protein